jgi:sulfite exporter TauE/SafE
MQILLITAISLGLVSSFHCLGMCGPIAFILPINQRSKIGKVIGLLAYNFGRVITYSFLGLLIGVFGEGLRFVGISQAISIVLGVGLILYVLLSKKIIKINFYHRYFFKFNNSVKTKLSGMLKKQSNLALLFTGLLNGLIPCGVVFIALQAALLQNSLLNSVFFMFVFGLGTIPMMFSISYLSNSFNKVSKIKINKVMPVLTIVVALLLIIRGLSLDIPYISPSYNEQQNEMNCCHK